MTVWVVAATTAILIVYDVWTGVKNGSDTTISWVMLSLSKKYPIIPFSFGVLMGHIFGVMK
jgi:hypothetical protein